MWVYGDVLNLSDNDISGGSWNSGVTVSQRGTRTYTSGSTTPLTGSASFTMSAPGSWLSFSGQTITAKENTTTYIRNVEVTVRASGSGGKTSSTTIDISQDAAYYLNVSPASLSFDAAGGSKTLTISTNESWTIS